VEMLKLPMDGDMHTSPFQTHSIGSMAGFAHIQMLSAGGTPLCCTKLVIIC